MLQKDLLLPWRTALRNVTLGLEIHDVPSRERDDRARQLLDMIGLQGFHDYYPSALSGGMRQRVGARSHAGERAGSPGARRTFRCPRFPDQADPESDMAKLVRRPAPFAAHHP
jgi:NitT/TauT family transport system ATP-binding protein